MTAYADTVLKSINYSPYGAAEDNVYPYGFTVNGSAGTLPLMCISYESVIDYNETWHATVVFPTTTLYKEEAYLFSLATANGATEAQIIEAQLAAWELNDPNYASDGLLGVLGAALYDPAAGAGSTVYATGVGADLTAAANFVLANPNDPSFYDHYLIYLPVDGSENPLADGTPQILIGFSPEPSSLILLGSGLLGFATFFYLKKRNGLKNLSTRA